MSRFKVLSIAFTIIFLFSCVRAKEPDIKDPFENVQTISIKDIENLLRPLLEEQVSGEFRFDLGRHPFPLDVVADASVKIEIHDLTLNDRKTRFSAKMLFKGLDVPVLGISGAIIPLTQVPALNRPVSPDETIREGDIMWISVPTRSVNRSMVTTSEQLAGAQPRNLALRADVPVRINDIRRIKSVRRGAVVRLGIRTAALSIETQAKALEDGEIGSVITLSNLHSNRVIQGKVLEPDYVEAFYSPESQDSSGFKPGITQKELD